MLRFRHMEQIEEEIVYPEFGEWLSVKEAVLYCHSKGLNRTPKTVGKWARMNVDLPQDQQDLVVERQDIDNGFRYVIKRESLDVKIEQEKDFDARLARDREAVEGSTPVQTGEVPAEEKSAPEAHTEDEELDRLRADNEKAKTTIEELSLDNRVKTQLVLRMKEERDGMVDRLEQRSHRIGALETKLLALGAPIEDQYSNPQNKEHSPQQEERGGALY